MKKKRKKKKPYKSPQIFSVPLHVFEELAAQYYKQAAKEWHDDQRRRIKQERDPEPG
jgi:hypothetical protein